jgi:hypothetical protein
VVMFVTEYLSESFDSIASENCGTAYDSVCINHCEEVRDTGSLSLGVSDTFFSLVEVYPVFCLLTRGQSLNLIKNCLNVNN